MYELTGKKIWVAGHRGMVGSALVRRLQSENCEIIVAGRETVDLTKQNDVDAFVGDSKPDAIVLAAARVGGILANDTFPADFLYDNLSMEMNVFHAAHKANVGKFLFLGSSCIYPKFAEQPIKESELLAGPLEETNQWYAIAKIAGIKLAQAYRRQHGQDFVSAMPTNLYGPGDNFNPRSSHVVPALIRKAHEAKVSDRPSIEIWGSGKPRREFLHVEDCADALVLLLKEYSEDEHINVGSGTDMTILELAQLICEVIGFSGEITVNTSMPDGTPRKLMSSEKLGSMNWAPKISMRDGLKKTYEWFLQNETEPLNGRHT